MMTARLGGLSFDGRDEGVAPGAGSPSGPGGRSLTGRLPMRFTPSLRWSNGDMEPRSPLANSRGQCSAAVRFVMVSSWSIHQRRSLKPASW